MTENIIFDMDGVLFDSERIYNRAWFRVGEKMALPDIKSCVAQCIGRNGRDTRAFLAEKYGPAFQADRFSEEIRKAFDEIVAAEGLPLKTGVREILTWLRGAGVKTGLATSTGRKSAERHLENAGLTEYFSSIVTGDMITNGKPAPDIYLLACKKLGVLPEYCFAVEDSPNGIRSAHDAGLKVIWVPDVVEITEETEKLLFKKFNSLLDVKAFLENL